MPRLDYGKVFSLFIVNGYDWDALAVDEQNRLINQLLREQFHGATNEQYGFAQTRVNQDVYYGHFTQQYEQVTTSYTSPRNRREETRYPFEDRFYLFVPRRNLFVLERRNFIRQPGLTPRGTEARIHKLIQDSLPRYRISFEKFSHTLSQEEMKDYFRNFPVVGLQVSGLRGRKVPEDFVFFNPNYEKNAVSRELFDEKILPFTDSLDLFSEAYKDRKVSPPADEDLRKNGLARVAAEVSPDIREIAIHHPDRGRQFVKPHYDDTIRITSETNDMDKVATELVDRVLEIPDIEKDIRMHTIRQARLFDQEE